MPRFVLLALTLALTTLLSAPAHAAVPMCSPDGRTVAAPPIVMPWRMVKLEAAPAPCPEPNDLLVLQVPEHQPRGPSSPPAPTPLRAVPVDLLDLPAPPGVRAPPVSNRVPTSRELVKGVYRPPRA